MDGYTSFRKIGYSLLLVLTAVCGVLFVLSRKPIPSTTPTGTLPSSTRIALTGEVESIDGSSFMLAAEKKKYRVVTSGQTEYARIGASIPYLMREPVTGERTKASSADLQKGMKVQVEGAVDGDTITARDISLPRTVSLLQGTIKKISSNTLVVEGVPVFDTPRSNGKGAWPPPPVTYTITVTEQTELSKEPTGSGTTAPVRQYTLSDLKADQMVIIYAAGDVTSVTKVTAARIEPLI